MTNTKNSSNEQVRVMFVTENNIISGNVVLPKNANIENPSTESLLLHIFNRGDKFIALHDSIIMDKDNTEFEPEKVKFFIINLDIVQTCKIVSKSK